MDYLALRKDLGSSTLTSHLKEASKTTSSYSVSSSVGRSTPPPVASAASTTTRKHDDLFSKQTSSYSTSRDQYNSKVN